MNDLKSLIAKKLLNTKSLDLAIPIRLSSDMNARISLQSSKFSINRTALLRTLIEVGLEVLEQDYSDSLEVNTEV
ncbi:MAG: hypothetical protein CVU00_07510 [Bacteroidetes bacterium HGW-Bacteroidetes-17]|jgi:predicted DNA-binding protein|nr:MAG: hypothetical protein CVU00_07510 [Bacteroidetes bacterium HGW-Bacteroidetes-17]